MDMGENEGGEVLPATNTNVMNVGRARELKLPKWDGITSAASYRNWEHVVFTNMHCAAAAEADAEYLINLIQNEDIDNADLRHGLTPSQCGLDAELYKGITIALCSGKTDAMIALTKLRETVSIGRGMEAMRMLKHELDMESGRTRTEAISKMIKLSLSNHASIDQCRVYLSHLQAAKASGNIDEEIALECMRTQILHVKNLETPFAAWTVSPSQTYKSLVDVMDRYLKLQALYVDRNNSARGNGESYASYIEKRSKSKGKGKGKGKHHNGNGKGKFNGYCHNCDIYGHTKADCTKPGGGQAGQTSNYKGNKGKYYGKGKSKGKDKGENTQTQEGKTNDERREGLTNYVNQLLYVDSETTNVCVDDDDDKFIDGEIIGIQRKLSESGTPFVTRNVVESATGKEGNNIAHSHRDDGMEYLDVPREAQWYDDGNTDYYRDDNLLSDRDTDGDLDIGTSPAPREGPRVKNLVDSIDGVMVPREVHICNANNLNKNMDVPREAQTHNTDLFYMGDINDETDAVDAEFDSDWNQEFAQFPVPREEPEWEYPMVENSVTYAATDARTDCKFEPWEIGAVVDSGTSRHVTGEILRVDKATEADPQTFRTVGGTSRSTKIVNRPHPFHRSKVQNLRVIPGAPELFCTGEEVNTNQYRHFIFGNSDFCGFYDVDEWLLQKFLKQHGELVHKCIVINNVPRLQNKNLACAARLDCAIVDGIRHFAAMNGSNDETIPSPRDGVGVVEKLKDTS